MFETSCHFNFGTYVYVIKNVDVDNEKSFSEELK